VHLQAAMPVGKTAQNLIIIDEGNFKKLTPPSNILIQLQNNLFYGNK
jgi:hypothetical protein